MRSGARQVVTGLVVNDGPKVRRRDYEKLEAILYNSVRGGPEAQNRERRPHFRDFLLGQIGYVQMVSPKRGARLRALFDQIAWSRSPTEPV